MNNASQNCKDESCHLKLSAMEEKKNDLIVQRIPQIEKTIDVLKGSNIAKREEGYLANLLVKCNKSLKKKKFLSRGLKFVLTANKIDWQSSKQIYKDIEWSFGSCGTLKKRCNPL